MDDISVIYTGKKKKKAANPLASLKINTIPSKCLQCRGYRGRHLKTVRKTEGCEQAGYKEHYTQMPEHRFKSKTPARKESTKPHTS